MPRLPFDPKRVAGPERSRADAAPARREGRQLKRITEAGRLTVSQLSELIKTTLEQRIASPLRVVGEVSNLNTPGHWYFSLKDESAVVSCVAWSTAAAKFGFTPKEGDEVVATGHVSHYGPQGRTQLYVSKLEPVGAGALELQFRAMCEALRKLGYFDDSRKKPLPIFPRRIAVVTSPTGAAIHDVINTAAQRCKAVGLLVVPVRVQGEGAKEDVARAIQWVDRHHRRLGVDAMLVTRGGGSIEDLWAFNERIVADAANRCSIPLIAAIGHESDTTVIELVADLRASTPTQAVMRLVPDAGDLKRQVTHQAHRLNSIMSRLIERQRERIDALARHPIFRQPEVLIQRERERLASHTRHLAQLVRSRIFASRAALERLAGRHAHLRPMTIVSARHQRVAVLEDRLERALRNRLDQRDRLDAFGRQLRVAAARHTQRAVDRVSSLERQLVAVDPRQVLRRGYSYTTMRDGTLIRSIRDVRPGDVMMTNVSDGSIESVVGGSARRPRRRGSAGADDGEQMDLFEQSQ